MKTRRLLAAFLILAFIFGYAAPIVPAESKAKSVTLSKKKVTLVRLSDKKVTLKLKNVPKKAKVTWSVSKGKKYITLSAKKKNSVKVGARDLVGTAKVTAKVKLPKKKKITKLTCTVKVVDDSYEPEVTPEPTLPPHVSPEGEPKFTIENGVLKGGTFTDVYEVTIPDGVKEIGKGAFAYCHTLEKIIIPEGVEKIDEKAFNDCTRLQEVTFPSTMKTVGKEAFFECVSLKTVNLNDGLISIGVGSFFQCRSMKSIVIPGSVTELGDYAFAWCEKLKTAEIGGALTEIPRELFDTCRELKIVNIPATVKSIGDRAFYDCSEVKGIVLPTELDRIGNAAFENCPLGEQTINAKVIGDKAFAASRLKNVVLGNNVEEIGKEAFNADGGETKGSEFVIPASVKKIDDEAFQEALATGFKVAKGNTILKSIDGVLFSADGETLIAYPLKKAVKNYTVPAGVKVISKRALQSVPISGKVTFPEGLKTIEDEALLFGQMTSVSLPNGLESIGSQAFFSSNIKTITLPDTVKDVGIMAFGSMQNLTKVKLSAGMDKIGVYLLKGCESLGEVIVPAGIKEIDPDAFMGSKKLESFKGIKFGEGSPFIVKDGFLYSDEGKKLVACDPIYDQFADEEKSLTIQDGVEEIGDYAISSGVNYVTIPDGVKKIGKFACGYQDRSESGADPGEYDQIDDFHIISDSKVVIDFAKKYHLNIVSEEDPEYFYNHNAKLESESKTKAEIVKKITLKAGETYDMKVKGVETKAYYTSSDPKIAKVDRESGKITAVANGTTSIVEAVERMFFVLEVTVTDGSDPVYDDGLKVFVDDDEDSVGEWEKLYFKYNPRLWFTEIDYPATNVYSGNSYNSVTAFYFPKDSYNYREYILNLYGEGNGQYYKTISENLEHELDEAKLNDDLLLFSGKRSFLVQELTGKAYVDSMIKSIGNTATYTNVISTSLYHRVANGFAAGAYSAILEIEGRKDKVRGMLIRQFSQYPAETEFLLNHGIKFKIVDAGVRRFFTRTDVYDNETDDSKITDVPGIKPYLRLQIV